MSTKTKGNRLVNAAMARPESAVIMVLAVIIVIVGIVEPKFFRVNNIMDVFRNAS